MSSSMVPAVPDAYSAGLVPLGSPQSRGVARIQRRDMDVLAARAELAHATDQARAFLASSALGNVSTLVGLAEQCYEVAPAGAPYYEAIVRAYGMGATRSIATF